MCGLFGWVRENKVKNQSRTQRQASVLGTILALANDNRGGDSWGYCGESDRVVGPVRGLGTFASARKKHFAKMGKMSWVIGHTRRATTGKVSPRNTHPFRIGSVLGAHNGMVFNHHMLNWEYDREYEVDSMHIFGHIDDGLDSFQDIEAYGAVTFHLNSSPREVYLGRFNDGELAVARVPYFGIVWSSRRGHLEMALETADLDGEILSLSEGTCYSASPDGLYRIGLELDFTNPWNRPTINQSQMMAQTGTEEQDERPSNVRRLSSDNLDLMETDELEEWVSYMKRKELS